MRFLSGLWSVILIYLSISEPKPVSPTVALQSDYLPETISFILLYLKTIFVMLTYFLFQNTLFCQNLLKTLLEVLFEMCSSIEGNWLLYNMEFHEFQELSISVHLSILASFYALQKNIMIFSNRFCTFLHRVTIFQSLLL